MNRFAARCSSDPEYNPKTGENPQATPIVLLRLLRCFIVVTVICDASSAYAAGKKQETFASPAAAVEALVTAADHDRSDDLIKILGPGSGKLVYSGDAVADDAGRNRFVSAYAKAHQIQAQGQDKAMLILGEKNWPFPIPLVKQNGVWRFDAKAGREEILDRRIGRNELNAIQVCHALVDAERDYAARIRAAGGIVEYASKLVSSPGRHDGLYWPAKPGEEQSPIGPLLAAARAEGYGKMDQPSGHQPYHGYYYQILKRQGKDAPDGAYDYMVNGHMIGGFAIVAYPAKYGASGIMTFIVNQDDVVYQKNLGPDTAAAASGMKEFDPDKSWTQAETTR